MDPVKEMLHGDYRSENLHRSARHYHVLGFNQLHVQFHPTLP